MESQNNDSDSTSNIFDQHYSILLINSSSNLGLPIGDNISSNSVHHSHQLVSTNSFELTATSLSEDSGLPHTNSSISSGDSIRVELCKHELELAESDGEVSQFDSLDNCSDGGMSAENFNTLKKGPLAPIDPPPEFQDSPQTTLIRSHALQTYALKIAKTVITNALKLYSTSCNDKFDFELKTILTNCQDNRTSSQLHLINYKSYEMYASDSLLNRHNNSITTDNIYDIPNADLDNSLENLNDLMKQTTITNKSSQINMCNNRKLLPTTSSNSAFPLLSKVSDIYDYEIYYGKRSNNNLLERRKTPLLCSPLHYHPGSNLSTSNRPNSRNSLNSRLSSSHNSLTVPTTNKADDSIFITQAMSHDALTGREISDFYNVPIDSDIYALPIDVIKPELIIDTNTNNKSIIGGGYKNLRGKLKYVRNNRKRRKLTNDISSGTSKILIGNKISTNNDKRHSVPENVEPMHMTLDEVKRFYHSLYSSSSDSSDVMTKKLLTHGKRGSCGTGSVSGTINNNNNIGIGKISATHNSSGSNNTFKPTIIVNNKTVTVNLKNKKQSTKDECSNNNNNNNTISSQKYGITTTTTNTTNTTTTKTMTNAQNTTTASTKKNQFSISMNLKQKFCSIFRFRKSSSHQNNCSTNTLTNLNSDYSETNRMQSDVKTSNDSKKDKKIKFSTRALPPLPAKVPTSGDTENNEPKEEKKPEENPMDFAANIEKVKEYGWYWGPISSEAAEKILSNEPDGSFIVRDSSDDHYIFSLTFKLNNSVRHVRIEQDQGTFSFGSCAKFKSHTIMEFIENAVESSRSGRYLFFFHRRPEHGPMRVQLTNPVSRFKHIQSLQHMCRFVIRKTVVRKDLIQTLPLPRRLLDYLSYKNCYSEQVESDSSESQVSDGVQASNEIGYRPKFKRLDRSQ